MLRDVRKAKKLSLNALAKKSGVHQVKICQYESGKLNPENMSLKNAIKLADALECDPREFMPVTDV